MHKRLCQPNTRKCGIKVDLIDLGMAVDPAPPRGNFGHYDFLILQCLSYKMRHVSPLRSVALSCNIKITYVTPQNVKKSFGVNAIIPFGTITYLFLSLYVLILFWGDF